MMVMRISLARSTVFGETSIRCRTFNVFQATSCLMLSKPTSISCSAARCRFREENKLAKKDRSVHEKEAKCLNCSSTVLVGFWGTTLIGLSLFQGHLIGSCYPEQGCRVSPGTAYYLVPPRDTVDRDTSLNTSASSR